MIDQLNQNPPQGRAIATTLEAAQTFWVAEDYHQKYLEKRGVSSCGL